MTTINLSEVASMSDEQAQQIMVEHHDEFIQLLEAKILPELKDLVGKLHLASPSKQLQLVAMDIESSISHLQDLIDNGADEPMYDKPRDDMDDQEEEAYDESDDLDFADEPEEDQPSNE
jgi:hypothetical protein